MRHLEDAAAMYDELAKRENWISVECFDSQEQADEGTASNCGGNIGGGGRRAGGEARGELVVMGFSDFVGNERIVNALRGALRAERVPHALLFTGASGVGKYTLARMFAQAATCERMKDDFCGECDTCKRVALLADPTTLVQQGLAERGESADAAMVERTPLILQTHPDVWAVVPDPVRLKTPVVRPMLRVGQIRAVQRAAYFQPMGRRRVFILDGADTMRWDVANVFLKILEEPPPSATLDFDCAIALFAAADNCVAMHAVSFRAAAAGGCGAHFEREDGSQGRRDYAGGAACGGQPGLGDGDGCGDDRAAAEGCAEDFDAGGAGTRICATVCGYCGDGEGPGDHV